jgi:hypothetical protein
MDAMSRTCLNCQAELGPSIRFCPQCGQQAGTDAPGTSAAGPAPGAQPAGTQPPGTQPAGVPQPGGPPPGTQPAGVPQPGGPGATVAARPPAALPPAQPPRAALPSPPGEAPTRADWPGPVVPPPGYPPPPQPFAAPAPYPGEAYGPTSAYPGESYGPTAPAQAAGIVPGFDAYQPGVLPAGPPFGPPRQPPRRHDGNRSSRSRALWLLLPLVLIGAGVAVLLARPFNHPAVANTASTGSQPASPAGTGAAAGSASPAASTPGAASPTAPAVTEQQAATSVATMLGQSVSDRTAISSAANDVGSCGPSLSSDAQVFGNAANSRKALLASLSSMPGRAALPPALLSDLTQAWQASIAADQAYATWATDEVSQGCVPNDTSDPGHQETTVPNQNATKYKTAFASQWNPIAAQYGLTQYQQGQL